MSSKKKKNDVSAISDGGGEWIYSYADLMSLLFCFFVILHSFNHVDENKMEDITKRLSKAFMGAQLEQVSKKTEDTLTPSEINTALQMIISQSNSGITVNDIEEFFIKAKADSSKLNDAFSKISMDLSTNNLIELGEHFDKTMRFTFSSEKIFSPNSNNISSVGEKLLKGLGDRLIAFSDILEIEINANVAKPRNRENLIRLYEASSNRAANVGAYLISLGLDPRLVSVKGRGAFYPLIESTRLKNDDSNKFNDRIEIVVKSKRTP